MMVVDQLATAAGEIGMGDRSMGETPAPIARHGAGDWRYGCDEGPKTAAPGTKAAI